ncbi:MAG: DUF805 domain-containing protein [Rickettsiales bacterium]|nr:DUF805 domain-containing protein [Rickettsiales bacterium]
MRYLSLTLLYESLVWLVMWFIYLFFSEESTEIFLWILAPVLIYVVQISFMVKRLHDVNMSGWFCLVFLVVSFFLKSFGKTFIILFSVMKGNQEKNKFGEVPEAGMLGYGFIVLALLVFMYTMFIVISDSKFFDFLSSSLLPFY